MLDSDFQLTWVGWAASGYSFCGMEAGEMLLLGVSGLIHSCCSKDKTAAAMPVSGPIWLQLVMANVVRICS